MDDSVPPTSASVSAETGGIEGNVLTDELQPIRRAQVQITPGSLNATSADDGSFTFSKLAPGKYVLIVAALGYYQARQSVDVVAGEIESADVILEQVPVSLPPFDELQKFTGTLPVSDACQAGEFTPETKDIAWRDHELIINGSKDGVPVAGVYLDIDLKSVDSPASVDVDLYVVDAAGKEVASSHTAAPDEHLEHDKYIAPGKYQVRVWICTGVNVKYAATVKVTYEQGERAEQIHERKKK